MSFVTYECLFVHHWFFLLTGLFNEFRARMNEALGKMDLVIDT